MRICQSERIVLPAARGGTKTAKDHQTSSEKKAATADIDGRSSAPADISRSNQIQSGLKAVVVIDGRALVRECIELALAKATDARVTSFDTVEAWHAVAGNTPLSAIVLWVAGKPRDADVQRQLGQLMQMTTAPIVVMGELEEPEHIIETIEQGARGYIPTSLPLAVAVQALCLVAQGGIYVPASSLMAARRQVGRTAIQSGRSEPEIFTARQAAVVEALCRGKANKVIAYELNMCESTVKVHVRNIMKKLKAKNRTEVAVMVRGLNGDELVRRLYHPA